jgi:uncharacterized protein DUF4845
MRRQKGVTLSGFMVWAVIVVIVLLIGFKLGPAYMEFHAIQKLFRQLASESMSGDFRGQVRRNFVNRSSIDNITAINLNDLQITKDGERVTIIAEYTVRVPLVYNISACMDFRATSEQE